MSDLRADALSKIRRSHELDTSDLALLTATQGVALAVLALTEPCRITITDEMVERGAKAAWNTFGKDDGTLWEQASESARADSRTQIIEALIAALEPRNDSEA